MFTLNQSLRRFLVHSFVLGFLCYFTSIVSAQDENQLERIESSKAKDFYETPKLTIINFDEDTAGEAVSTKQSVNDLYTSKGVSFSSESPDSVIQAFRYNCKGISGDKCAGNSKPPFGGVMRITFHVPDDKDTKATVTEFGFFVSAVKKDGTTVEAYDFDDKLIGSITTIQTIRSNSQFMGAKSKIPIHYLRIVPNDEIDPDFAMDDLAFSTPEKVE